jgi:hypothetical protein
LFNDPDPREAGLILQGIGLALIIVYAVTVTAVAVPVELLQPQWIERVSGSLRGGASFPLVGAGLIWLGYTALVTGWPSRIAANFARLEPGFVAQAHWGNFAIALAASLAWILVVARSERTPLRGIVHWCYGTTFVWLLLMTLWLPWIDYGRSYRPVALSLKAAMTARAGSGNACVSTAPLGLAERASFAYFADIRFGEMAENCAWLLVQGARSDVTRAPTGMRLAWEGNRPGDRSERFRLYQRIK